MPNATLRQIFARDPLARLVPPGPMSESEFPMPRPAEAEDAPLVRDEVFAVYNVAQLPTSEFTHFLDGAQKVCKVMYYGMEPMVIAHTSAALIERKERDMRKLEPTSIVASLDLIGTDHPALQAIANSACDRFVPVEPQQAWSPQAVGAAVREKVGFLRQEHEQVASQSFQTGRLLVDGPLGQVSPSLKGKFYVGLVKSHERLYVKDPSRQRMVFELKRGQRSSIFHRGKTRYSFYLRTRSEPHTEPLFGIVRIEIPAEEEFLEQADVIAGWVLAETCPLSLPDPRYHVLPYPIHVLEMHLKARQPSDAKIRGILGI